MKNILCILFLISTNLLFSQSSTTKFKYVTLNAIPKPTAPPDLIITELSLSDANGNRNEILDAEENAELKFEIENKGQGTAYAVLVQIEDRKKVKGLKIPNTFRIGDLKAGEKKSIIIPISGLEELETTNIEIAIKVLEGNHFDVIDPLSISFKSKELKKPIFTIDEHTFKNKDKEGKILKGKIIQLAILLHNTGDGEAKNVTISFSNPNNIFPATDSKLQFPVLKANETKKVEYEFMANTAYSDSIIPISINVTELKNRYSFSETKSVSLEAILPKVTGVVVEGKLDEKITYSTISLTSDVDKNIPESKIKYDNKYALIIGNEDYKASQPTLEMEQNVEFAINDARSFKEYCEKTFGIPKENITYLANGTLGQMKQKIALLNAIMKNSSGDLDIYFYYAGHGAPDEQTKEPYLIPVDVSGTQIKDGIKLKDVFSAFTEYKSNKVTMFIDACFSGGARNQELTANRGIKIVPRSDFLSGNIVSFSASSGKQSSYPYSSKNHGIFTYFLLKSIQETNGDITYKEMWDKVKSKVSTESLKVNGVEQNPQENVGNEVEKLWEKWKFKQ